MPKPPTKTARTPLEKAIDWAGSIQALAHEARVSENTVRGWMTNGRAPRPMARLIAVLMLSDPHHPKVEQLERSLSGR